MTTSTGINIVITAKDKASPAIDKTRAGLESISRQLQVVRNAWLALLGVTGLSGGVAALANMADQVQQVNARLRLAVDGARKFAEAQQFAYRVAAKTGAGYEAIATLYGRLAQSASSYGLSQEQIAKTTEATALALKVSGASAAEAASVVRQFSQALGSGVLRGDEFNSIMENGGRLAKALADGLGLPIGKLRALAEQGLLTTDIITRALESQSDALQREADAMPRTIGQALSQVRDEFGKTVDRLNQAGGITSKIADAFVGLARHIDAVFGAALMAAVGAVTVALTRMGHAAIESVGKMLVKINADRQAAATALILSKHEVAKAQAMLASAKAAVANATGMARLSIVQNQLVPAQQRLAAAQAELNAAMNAGSVSARALSTALGFLGGPLGSILTMLTLGATAWAIWGNNAESAANKAKQSADRASEALDRLRKRQKYGDGDVAALREEIERLEKLQDVRRETLARGGSPGVRALFDRDQRKLEEYRKALKDLQKEEESLGKSNLGKELLGKQFDKYLDQYRKKLDPLAAALKELREQAKNAGIALDSKQFKDAEALVRASVGKDAGKGEKLTRLPYLKKPMEDDIRAMQAALKTQSDIIETALAARLVKVADYWKAKEAIDAQAFAVEREKLSRELAAQEDLIARLSRVKPRDANQQAEIVQRLDDARAAAANLRAELDALNGREMAAKFRLEIDREKALQDIRDAVAEAQAEIARMTGTETPEMRRAAIERAMRDTIEKLKQDAEGAALAERLIDLKAKEAELAAFERQWSAALERMHMAEQSANAQAQAGLITTSQAQAMIASAHREAAAAMEDLLPKMEAIANALGPEAVAKVELWKTALLEAKNVIDPVAAAINTDVKNAFAAMFEQIGTGAKNAKEAFLDFARAVVASLQRIAAQKLAEQIFGSFGRGGGGIGGFFAGLFRRFATGGPVPGSGTRDTVPAMLTPGEYVIRRDVARRIGYRMLDAINGGGWLPSVSIGRLAFASGGAVPAVGGTVNNVSVVVNTDAVGRVQGDSAAAADLGRRIEAAVRGVLVAEKRPGGLLAGA